MKGKHTFTGLEIAELERLIVLRNKTETSKQKAIRQKMRDIGFYGKDDWGITDLQISDLRSLIKSGCITVIGNIKREIIVQSDLKVVERVKSEIKNTTSVKTDFYSVINAIKKNRFDPVMDSERIIDDSAGNYILCLRKNAKLPIVSIKPAFTLFEGLEVIYTGIAGKSLRCRDYRQHFKGNNAGRSTLRKSLGVLFGYKQIPRDKDVRSGKTKFNEKDELRLTEWMCNNLIMYFLKTNNYNAIEIAFINQFNPPLNLKNCYGVINSDYRQLLSSLRVMK